MHKALHNLNLLSEASKLPILRLVAKMGALARRMRPVLALALVVFAFGTVVRSLTPISFVMGDFRAFHCAARVALEHQNIYATAPMAACESRPQPKPLLTLNHGTVLPAPIPGYLATAFFPLGALPFPVAAVLALLLLVAAVAAATWIFQHLGVSDWPTFLIASSMLIFGACLPFGELPPFALLGIALAAWGARDDSAWKVGLGFALTMIEPQIGIAVGLLLAIVSRRFIVPLAAVSVALGVMSLIAVGVPGNIEYVRTVLPEHVYSELPSVMQFSLSWVLWAVHVSDATALLFGRLSYVAMLLLVALVATTRYAREHRAHAVLIAPALAIVGGPFLHFDHIALAVPAALYACNMYARRYSIVLAALIALALPMLLIFSRPGLLYVAPLIAGLLVVPYTSQRIVPLRAAAVVVCIISAIVLTVLVTGVGSVVLADTHTVSNALSQASWGHYVRQKFVMESWSVWLIKVPTWFGILVTAGASLLATGLGRERLALRSVQEQLSLQ